MTQAAVNTETVTFTGPQGTLSGYLATPEGGDNLPGVVIIHENQGLTEHIKDVCRRMAAEGFAVLAPDALSLQGGTPSDKDEAIAKIKTLNDDDNVANFQAGVDFLRALPGCNGKVGSVGFCWGGRTSGLLAVNSDDLDAAVIYYGKSPDSDQVKRIQCPMLMHYGANDDNINATVPDFRAALEKEGKDFTMHMYDGAGHAFNNDTRPDRFHAGAAAESWPRTVAFLSKVLS